MDFGRFQANSSRVLLILPPQHLKRAKLYKTTNLGLYGMDRPFVQEEARIVEAFSALVAEVRSEGGIS